MSPADEGRLQSVNKPECDKVLNDVWLFLDNEMDPDARAAVVKHLDDCSPCLEEAGIEEKLKKLVHRGCHGERAPEHLRVRLASAIQSVTVTAVSGPDGTSVQVEQVRVIRTSEPGDPADG